SREVRALLLERRRNAVLGEYGVVVGRVRVVLVDRLLALICAGLGRLGAGSGGLGQRSRLVRRIGLSRAACGGGEGEERRCEQGAATARERAQGPTGVQVRAAERTIRGARTVGGADVRSAS